MNTYSHALWTLAAARRLRPDDPAAAWAAVAGAALPDLPYLARAAALLARRRGRLSAGQVLAVLDYGGATRWAPDLALHSLVPLLPAAALAAAPRAPRARTCLLAFTAGWAAHCLADLPVHATDARPPFWPLSDHRWHSPVSNWDRRAHALPVAAAEHLLTALAVACLAAQQGWKPPRPAWAARARRFGARQRDLAAFAARFARHPARVGAITPTSARTAAAMLDFTDLRAARLVVELGPGTGAFTRELLQRAGPDTRILAIEIDPVLATRLGQRFTDKRLTVITDTAEHAAAYLCGDQPDVIISAVPLTTLSSQVRKAILAQCARVLAPGGVMLAIQYTPARQADLERAFGSVRRRYSVRNLPPAFLYACAGPRTCGTAGC